MFCLSSSECMSGQVEENGGSVRYSYCKVPEWEGTGSCPYRKDYGDCIWPLATDWRSWAMVIPQRHRAASSTGSGWWPGLCKALARTTQPIRSDSGSKGIVCRQHPNQRLYGSSFLMSTLTPLTSVSDLPWDIGFFLNSGKALEARLCPSLPSPPNSTALPSHSTALLISELVSCS